MADKVFGREEEKQIPRLLGEVSSVSEVSEEFLLPDYMPPVSRVLRIESRAIPEDKYLGDGNVEYSGEVAYTVLYATGDSQMCSVALDSDYSGRCEIPEDVGECHLISSVESAGCRLLGPRKLSLKAKILTRAMLWFDEPFCEICDNGNLKFELERLTEEYSYCKTFFCEAKNVKAELEAPELEGTPIFCSAAVQVTGVSAKNEAVLVTGNVLMKVLSSVGDGYDYVSALRKIPFERIVRCDNCRTGDRVSAEGCIVSASVGNRNEEKSGCEAVFDLSVTVSQREKTEICLDAYGVSSPSSPVIVKCASKEFQFCDSGSVMGNFTFTAAARRDAAAGAEVIDVYIRPEVTSAAVEDGRLILTGIAKINTVISEKNEGDREGAGAFLSSGEFQSQFRYECESPVEAGELFSAVSATVMSASGRIEGDKLHAEGEIALSGTVWSRKNVTAVKSTSAERAERRDSSLVLVYPESGESLWDISKRYGVSASVLAENNAIDLGKTDPKRYRAKAGTPLLIDLI